MINKAQNINQTFAVSLIARFQIRCEVRAKLLVGLKWQAI